MPKNSTPRRKRMNRKKRLSSAKRWIENYEGNKIVKAYSKWFGVDLICTIKELRILNIEISEQYEKGIRSSMDAIRTKKLDIAKRNSLKLQNIYGIDYDENFAIITGFTNGGAPFGLSHEKLKNKENDENDL